MWDKKKTKRATEKKLDIYFKIYLDVWKESADKDPAKYREYAAPGAPQLVRGVEGGGEDVAGG